MGKVDLARIMDEIRVETRMRQAAGIVEEPDVEEEEESQEPPRPKKRRRRAPDPVASTPLYKVPDVKGQDLPELLLEVQRDAKFRLTRVLNWDNSIKRPPWLLGLYAGWMNGVPYVGTGRVFIAGLMMPVVTVLASQGKQWPMVSLMVRQRGIELVTNEQLAGIFPLPSAITMNADVVSFDDEKGSVRVRGRGVRYETYVNAIDLAMAWRGTPPPHHLVLTNRSTDPVLLYDGQGNRSLIVAIPS